MLEQSKVDCSVLSFENELFVALNPATHMFDLSRLNKITGKTLSRVDNEEQIIKNSNRNVHVFIDEALENQDEFFIVCKEEKSAYVIEIKELHKLLSDHLIGLSFSEEHEKYINVLTVVKTLLLPHGLTFGDSSEELPLDLLEKLNLEEEEVIIASDEVLSEGETIKKLVAQMCA